MNLVPPVGSDLGGCLRSKAEWAVHTAPEEWIPLEAELSEAACAFVMKFSLGTAFRDTDLEHRRTWVSFLSCSSAALTTHRIKWVSLHVFHELALVYLSQVFNSLTLFNAWILVPCTYHAMANLYLSILLRWPSHLLGQVTAKARGPSWPPGWVPSPVLYSLSILYIPLSLCGNNPN